jgi:hypothetical protein
MAMTKRLDLSYLAHFFEAILQLGGSYILRKQIYIYRCILRKLKANRTEEIDLDELGMQSDMA